MATSSRRPDALQRPQQQQHQQQHYQRRAHPHPHSHPHPNPHQQHTTNHTINPNIKNINPATASLDANSVAAKHAHVIATHIKTRNSQNILQQTSPSRMKRPLDPIANNYDPPKTKRARITVEILARPTRPIPSTNPPRSITANTVKPQSQPQFQPETRTNEPPVASTQILPAQRETTKTATAVEPGLKRHKEKAINGIKHELDRLQPSATDTNSATERPGRKLRSQEATRFKSELSAYFPDYDEVIGNDPKEQHVLNLDTPIVLVDTDPLFGTHQSQPPVPPPGAATDTNERPHTIYNTVRTYGDHLFANLYDSQRIDFAFLEARYNGKDVEDPLPDAYFGPAHKKAERLEKSIRNTEKGRAQHEKDQIIRLLNELQGHDWLRTMGVSGVTESRKKTFEPARDHFIKGCQAILEKFRVWSQEEKKRKLMKERALAEEAEENEEKETEEEDNVDEQPSLEGTSDEDEEMGDVETDHDIREDISDGDPPDYSDADASARQLLDEALARAKYTASSSKRSRGEPPPPKSPEPYVAKEFTSFFVKKHQREAALNKGRRRGRTIVAWGHPIPDMVEGDFELPEEYRDIETLKAHERQKRRERRQRQH
ncbi:something about silencing, SAS, complex subunit 4-domain-containing protein [Daldinia decipiens]|uniref:something about silencing, SAS, complex subunit 4-domain-containing protein n=1 Tax=Daldinia decipiens TaxID=326647 RepID=UPI0020C56735|nr:something about silencing, SAS, complex subunit 4-domain-containing protein [Daldinia decipiens]KAI1657807.1 something about silencing, SAS, complex subunit 4-domain-containing protein [Daldinia decipiens]